MLVGWCLEMGGCDGKGGVGRCRVGREVAWYASTFLCRKFGGIRQRDG